MRASRLFSLLPLALACDSADVQVRRADEGPRILTPSGTDGQPARREVAVTFDDLPGVAIAAGQYCNPDAFEEMNRKLVLSISVHQIPALGLVVGSRLCERRRDALPELLGIWLDAGLEHIFDFFEKWSVEVAGYEIKQVLLLHANPLNAQYFDQLVQMMQRRGYAFISVDQALEDPAYDLPDTYAGPRGLSWLHRWALTKGIQMREEPREPESIANLYRSYSR